MKIAIVGCGTMGRIHANCAARTGFSIKACADPVKRKASELAKQFGATAYSDGIAAIGRDDVEAVVIATPTPLHEEYVRAAARAGKHILCEKPLARTSVEAKRAFDGVQKAGVKLFAGHVVRYFHEFEALKAQVESGKIGEVGFVKTYRGGFCPSGEKNWYRDFEQSGGVLFDVLIHDFDWIRYALGKPVRIFAQHLQKSNPRPMDYGLATLTLESGAICQAVGSWAHAEGFRVKAELCGDKGMVQFDSANAPVRFLKRGRRGDGAPVPIASTPLYETPYDREWSEFSNWLRNNETPRVSAEDAMEAVAVAEAALKSAATGKPVNL